MDIAPGKKRKLGQRPIQISPEKKYVAVRLSEAVGIRGGGIA